MIENIKDDPVLGRSVGLVEATVEDNCIEHGTRGILHHKDIEQMISLYSEEDKQARIYGKFQHLTGLVFKEFARNIHVIRPFRVNPRDYCVIERLDTHTRTQDACLWVAIDRQNNYYVVDELWGHYETEALAIHIKQKASQFRVIDRRIDPSAFNKDQHDLQKPSLAQELDKDRKSVV